MKVLLGNSLLWMSIGITLHWASPLLQAQKEASEAGANAAAPTLSLELKPQHPSISGEILAVIVHERAEDLHTEAGKALLTLPLVISNVQTIADAITDLMASDNLGEIPLTSRIEAATPAHPEQRVWITDRAVRGAVNWSYKAPTTDAPNPRGAAPPLELRTEDSAFSGQAATFLLLPDDAQSFRVALHWDLSLLPTGAVAMSSLGMGDQNSSRPLNNEEMRTLYFFAGLLHPYPDKPTAQGFFSAVQGQPPFNGVELMRWTESLYRYYYEFFRPQQVEPYAVLLRSNPINAGGGVELGNAFVGTFDAKTDPEALKMTLAHEMAHTFVRALNGEEFTGAWFSEGIAVYYEHLLPLRAGKISVEDYLRDVNSTAARYYTNALQHTPNSEIGAHFWEETRVRVLPYDRGSLYFAELDYEIRRASAGKSSLDNLIQAMIERRRQGKPMDETAWRELLHKRLGQSAIVAFDAMLRGDTVLPEANAFGPCFTRTTQKLRRYDLGFDSKVLIEPLRIVRGLRADSNAAKAGLQNGDQIVHPIPQDGIQGDQKALLHLLIERNGKQFSLDYLPRGEEVDAYQWQILPEAKLSSCTLAATE